MSKSNKNSAKSYNLALSIEKQLCKLFYNNIYWNAEKIHMALKVSLMLDTTHLSSGSTSQSSGATYIQWLLYCILVLWIQAVFFPFLLSPAGYLEVSSHYRTPCSFSPHSESKLILILCLPSTVKFSQLAVMLAKI